MSSSSPSSETPRLLQHVTTYYLSLRQSIGRSFLHSVVRKYLPNPATEEKLLQLSQIVSSKTLQITPEDLCLGFLFIIFSIPAFFIIRTGLWRWILEAYACLVFPTLISMHALESNNHESIHHLLVYWVGMSGCMRVVETLIPFLRGAYPNSYPLFKSFISICWVHFPWFRVVSKWMIHSLIFPWLGFREQNGEMEEKDVNFSQEEKKQEEKENKENEEGKEKEEEKEEVKEEEIQEVETQEKKEEEEQMKEQEITVSFKD